MTANAKTRGAPRHRWRVAFGIGVLIEVGMVLLLVVLPRESWSWSRVLSFLEYTHYPFLWFLNAAGPESVVGGLLAVVVTGLCMALVWGCLLVGGSALLSNLLKAMRLSARQRRLLGWGLAIICGAGLVYVAADSFGDRPAAFAPTPAVKALVGGNNVLALDLYRKLRTAPGNVFFSPFGISTGLGLVSAAARGGTERELGRAAHFGVAPAELHAAFGELIARMGELQHGSRLTLLMPMGCGVRKGIRFITSSWNWRASITARRPSRSILSERQARQPAGSTHGSRGGHGEGSRGWWRRVGLIP